MLLTYLGIYKRIHSIFKAFSVTEKQKDDYTSNIFVFSFIILLDFIGILSLLNKMFNFSITIPLSWLFVLMGFVILIINTLFIYKHKSKIEDIDLDENRRAWLIFIVCTILLQFWPILYMF